MSGTEGTEPTSVSTHILDTSIGRPAAGVGVRLSVRGSGTGTDGASGGGWAEHGASRTDADGRCKDFPALPEGTAQVRLLFETEPYFLEKHGPQHRNPQHHDPQHHDPDQQAEVQQDAPRVRDSAHGGFFPEVTITFTVDPGEHYHVPLLLNPFGYSVYRGS